MSTCDKGGCWLISCWKTCSLVSILSRFLS